MSDFFSVKALDSHVHMIGWDCLDYMKNYRKKFGMEGVCIACCGIQIPKDPTHNMLGAILKLQDEHFYASSSLVYPDYPVKLPIPADYDFFKQVKELWDIGFDGMKMLENKPTFTKATQFAIDRPEYEDYFTFCEENDIHITWHSCDPEEFWDKDRAPAFAFENGWFYGDGTYPDNATLYAMIDHVLERHPKLHAAFAHFFFLSDFPERAQKLLDTYPNVFLDITPGREMYGNFTKHYDFYHEFFRKYSNRIIFGSDMNSEEFQGPPDELLGAVYRFLTTEDRFSYWDLDIRGIGLGKEDAERIMSGNFLRECPKPRPVNKAALKEYIEKYSDFVPEEYTRRKIQEFAASEL